MKKKINNNKKRVMQKLKLVKPNLQKEREKDRKERYLKKTKEKEKQI